MELTDNARMNRAHWDAESDDYQARHAGQLAREPLAWGVWSIPEAELNVLGDVRGKDVLEYGCGAAQWSIGLTKRGARCTGLDNSAKQLEHARRAMAEANVGFPLVHASAEAVPLPDASFDVVFCDHGAMTFADPDSTVPEAARLLRPGGLLAFNAESPLHFICWNAEANAFTDRLVHDYFETVRSQDEGAVSFSRPYGEWLRLFRRHGFAVEDLIELRPPEGARTTYEGYVTYDWARRWPAEQIWRVRRT
ncbi:MAG: Methyltransferase type 11 [Candidatus Eremiobacteraeota bacterium]|nr:Methyltransferase type 11 [Candidatus Eremiobacteraeota bacterium]